MSSNKSLKHLASRLELSESFIKNLAKGGKVKKSNFIVLNTANCLRKIAEFSGYKNADNARKAIEKTLRNLFLSAEKFSQRIEKYIPKYGKHKQQILIKAVAALKSGNFGEYNKLISTNKDLSGYKRKFLKRCNTKLIEKFRSQSKQNNNTARQILLSVGTPNGSKIIVPEQKIQEEIEKRMKRYGAVSSLFWSAAKQLNPNIKPKGLSKEKRKKHKLKDGSTFKTKILKDGAEATVKHLAEVVNPHFRKKLKQVIDAQEKFWAKVTENEIVAADVLNKLLNDA